MQWSFQDDLPISPSISRLRASGSVTSDTKLVVIGFGEGESAWKRQVGVTHQRFPNGGEWSFFVCPVCRQRARVLRLWRDGRPMCSRCCAAHGAKYRIAYGSQVERAEARAKRIEKLRKLLDCAPARLHPRPGRTLDRRGTLTASLRRAMIVSREDLLRPVGKSWR
jgi:hypothetical protein